MGGNSTVGKPRRNTPPNFEILGCVKEDSVLGYAAKTKLDFNVFIPLVCMVGWMNMSEYVFREFNVYNYVYMVF